ncbi:hypothetical protein ARSEF4850_002723 [Beauveria asiatica]
MRLDSLRPAPCASAHDATYSRPMKKPHSIKKTPAVIRSTGTRSSTRRSGKRLLPAVPHRHAAHEQQHHRHRANHARRPREAEPLAEARKQQRKDDAAEAAGPTMASPVAAARRRR